MKHVVLARCAQRPQNGFRALGNDSKFSMTRDTATLGEIGPPMVSKNKLPAAIWGQKKKVLDLRLDDHLRIVEPIRYHTDAPYNCHEFKGQFGVKTMGPKGVYRADMLHGIRSGHGESDIRGPGPQTSFTIRIDTPKRLFKIAASDF